MRADERYAPRRGTVAEIAHNDPDENVRKTAAAALDSQKSDDPELMATTRATSRQVAYDRAAHGFACDAVGLGRRCRSRRGMSARGRRQMSTFIISSNGMDGWGRQFLRSEL
jgi:hypothetical protein